MSGEGKNLAIGAVSGILPLAVSLPIDYIKVSIQVKAEGQRHFHSHPIQILKETYRDKGVPEFYRGLPAAIVRQFFLGSLRLGGYRIALEKVNSLRDNPLNLAQQSILSFFVGGAAAWVASPFDLILLRLQSDRLLPEGQKRLYKGSLNAVYRVVKEEKIKGLWAGAAPTVLRVSIINSISIPGYELIKRELDYLYGFAASHRIYASTFSAVLSCVVSLPVDNFKTKLQKMVKNSDGTEPYKGLWDCVVKSVQREGIGGLYVGFPVYVTRIAPHVTLSMLIQDFLHHHL